MKFIVFSFFLLLLFCTSSLYAQEKFLIGLNAGVNDANQSENHADDYSNYSNISKTPGFLEGFEIDYRANEIFSLRLQFFLEQKHFLQRSQSYGTDTFSSDTTDLSLNYAEIPFTLRYTFIANSWNVYAFAGPSIGFVLNSYRKIHYKGVVDVLPDTGYAEFSHGAYRISMAVYGGAGVSYNFSANWRWFVEGGYSLGLVPFIPAFENLALHDTRIYTGVLLGIN